MEKKEIKLTIDNPDVHYKYEGIAEIKKDIIKFIDKDTSYIYDMGIERLVKESKDSKITIDFKKESITILVDNNKVLLNMKIKKKKITKNSIFYCYNIDNNEVKFEISLKEV